MQSSKSPPPVTNSSNEIFSVNVNNENCTDVVLLSSNGSGHEKENETNPLLNTSSNESNVPMTKSSLTKAETDWHAEEIPVIHKENSLRNKKKFKRSRRRKMCFSRNPRRRCSKKKVVLSNDEEFWMKKYSIESFSIVIDRCEVPEKDF